MKKVDAFLVNSFTHNGTGGNPAGVVLSADELSNQEKLEIAQVIGFSETAFVSKDNEADFEVSFFTVTDEVDFCGHATLAAFSTMYHQGILTAGTYTQRTKAGLLGVTIESNGHIVMDQTLPEYREILHAEDISKLIGLDSAILKSTSLPIEVISTGLPDIIVPVPNGYLDKIILNESLTSEFCQKHNVVGIHAFELCDNSSNLTASCRNFAPLFGIAEESATGSASGALACYLTKHVSRNDTNEFTFEQGRAMGCTSSITALIESNKTSVQRVLVGGFADVIKMQEVRLLSN